MHIYDLLIGDVFQESIPDEVLQLGLRLYIVWLLEQRTSGKMVVRTKGSCQLFRKVTSDMSMTCATVCVCVCDAQPRVCVKDNAVGHWTVLQTPASPYN